MFSLLHEIVSLLQSDEYTPFNALIIGIDDSGKSNFIEYFASTIKNEMPNEVINMTTIGVNTRNIKYHSNDITLWDIGGTESFRSVWNRYITESNAIIYCIDSSNLSRLEESLVSLEEVKKYDTKNQKVAFILTKIDKKNNTVLDRIEQYSNSTSYLSKVFHFSINHIDHQRIHDILDWILH